VRGGWARAARLGARAARGLCGAAVGRGEKAGEALSSPRAVSAALRFALERRPEIFDGLEVTAAPVALFYDLDAYDRLLSKCASAFGGNFRHYVAAKANPVLGMLGHAHARGFGVECASIGELLLAHEHLGVPTGDVVFDSPAKTARELEYAVEHGIRCHLDNFAEYERVLGVVGDVSRPRQLGFRVNPSSVGEGSVKALSVSTPDSKFGVDIADAPTRARLLDLYVQSPFLDSVHVHVGSAGMAPETQLAEGVRAALDLALEVNARRPESPLRVIDIGGGLPVNYASDALETDSVPSFERYASFLRARCPELFDGRFTVLTEFGQSLNAKAGFLASRVEFVKKDPHRSAHLAIVHFGADVCLRQAYAAAEHPRRFAAFSAADAAFKPPGATRQPWSIGGPLCFQGDFVATALAGHLPDDLHPGDLLVMLDAGANTLSLFSRHCARFAPPVYGFRWTDPDLKTHIADMVLLKPREDLAALANFWSPPRQDQPLLLRAQPSDAALAAAY